MAARARMITGIAGCRTDQTECESAMYLIEVTKLPIASGTGRHARHDGSEPESFCRDRDASHQLSILPSMELLFIEIAIVKFHYISCGSL